MDRDAYLEYLRKVVAHQSMGDEEREAGKVELQRRAHNLVLQQGEADALFWQAGDSDKWTVVYMISNDLDSYFGTACESTFDKVLSQVVRSLALMYWVGRHDGRLAHLLADVDVGEEEE